MDEGTSFDIYCLKNFCRYIVEIKCSSLAQLMNDFIFALLIWKSIAFYCSEFIT